MRGRTINTIKSPQRLTELKEAGRRRYEFRAFRAEEAMKTSAACFLILIQLFTAHSELTFRDLSESQTLVLSCSTQQDHGSLIGLHLYHRGPHSQTTVMSLIEGVRPRVDPAFRGRLQLQGELKSPQVNVTITGLQAADSGLYMCELSCRRRNGSEQVVMVAQKVVLQVKGTVRSCRCSASCPPLILTMFTFAAFIMLTLCWLLVDKCLKSRRLHQLQPSAPIYEEMTRKQQSASVAQNNPEASSHLEEVNFPVYANPNIRQPQENYYACPRQLALRA